MTSSLRQQKSKTHPSHDIQNGYDANDDANEFSKSTPDDDPIECAGARWISKALTKDDLKSADTLKLLWEFYVRRGWNENVSDQIRQWFFGCARYAIRKGRPPGACFTDCIHQQRYNAPTDADHEWARIEIKRVFYGSWRLDTESYNDDEAQPEEPEFILEANERVATSTDLVRHAADREEFLALPDSDRRSILDRVLLSSQFIRKIHAKDGPEDTAVIAACVSAWVRSRK